MSRSIGFRAESARLNWAVVQSEASGLVLVDSGHLDAPEMSDEAGRLSWYRQRILTLLEVHQPDLAFVRYPETNIRLGGNKTGTHCRHRIEGVVLEALSSASIKVHTGPLSTIASKLSSKTPKAYLSADEVRGVKFNTKSPELREAILVAVAALEEKNGN